MGEQSLLAGRPHRGGFLDRLGGGLLQAMQRAFDAEEVARRNGLLQRLDPRVKLVGLGALIVVAVSVRSLSVLAGLFAIAVALAAVSQVSPGRLFRQVWLGVLIFTGAIALPALFLVPGDPLLRLPVLDWPVTQQGLTGAAFLIGRAETAATYALLLILCTPWPHVLKALRCCRVPVVVVAILGMTHRHIFTLLQAAAEMVEARRSRSVGRLSPRERRRVATAIAGELFGKALHLSTEVHLAMVSRGYRGEIRLLDDFRMAALDWAALAGFAAVAAGAVWLQA